MSKLSEAELRYIIEQGETATVEFKLSPPRPAELAERFCGMANAQGGLVIIGVEDTSLRIVGVRDVRLAVDVTLRAARQITPALLLDPPEPEIYVLDEKQLIVVGVPPNHGPLYQSSGVCWIRRGSHTVPLNVAEILEIANNRGLVSWELQPISRATMEDIDLERVRSYLKLRSVRSHRNSRFKDSESVLLGLGCAIVTNSGQVVPTNAGLLFFGCDPQRYLPQSEIVCVVYRDELGIGGYVDRKIITGTLQELIDDAGTFLNDYITREANIERWKQTDSRGYSLEAVREAIINAVVHRDYSRQGECIRIFFFADRIEVHSPGLLLPGITLEQMRQNEVISRLRNPVLANLLRDIPGYIERIGSGMRLMYYETRKIGLPEPQFRDVGEFVVIFRNAPLASSVKLENKLPIIMSAEQGNAGSIHHTVLLEQKHRVEVALRYVQEHGSIANGKYRELTGASGNTARRDLEMLAEWGTLKRIGKRRGSQYTLP